MAVPLLVVEDDARLRTAIQLVLSGAEWALTMTATAKEALRQLESSTPSLALVDLGLPDLDGVELIARMTALRPALPILVLTSAQTEERILAAIKAGARGYLFKEDLGRRLCDAVGEALHGGVPLSPAVANLLLAQVRGPQPSQPVAGRALSPREHEVLERLARSCTYEEVAADLGVSLNTVRTHVRTLYDKMDVSTRNEAVMAALERGLLKR
ncbi:MAG: two-component response regulator [bacterium]|nr:two-component response regulator [bacterium]